MKLTKKRLANIAIPGTVWDKNWVVYSKPAVQGANRVLSYLGRYVHRVAITNARILDCDENCIRIHYLDRRKGQYSCASLQPEEFIRRFLQHVLPRGFHKVRTYGLLSPRYRKKLVQIKQELGGIIDPDKAMDENEPAQSTLPDFGTCPDCKKGILIPLYWLPPRKRAPPLWN